MIIRSSHLRHLVFLFLVVAYGTTIDTRILAAPFPDDCAEVCSASACGSTCYESELDFINGTYITCLQWGDYDPDEICCGDELCNMVAGESCGSCAGDCGSCPASVTCNNSQCEPGEDCHSCSADCGTCTNGSGCNDDGTCQDGEDASCMDCLITNRTCSSSSDCSTPSAYDLVCVDGRCVAQDYPSYTSQCIDSFDCSPGWFCKETTGLYSCGTCKVCLPGGTM